MIFMSCADFEEFKNYGDFRVLPKFLVLTKGSTFAQNSMKGFLKKI